MLNLTFGEQVKIILSRKNMTIKELAETIEERTGKKMSRQNLTQRLSRDNFQEQDMRMIAEILGCSFYLSILDSAESTNAMAANLPTEEELEKLAKKKKQEAFTEPEEEETVGGPEEQEPEEELSTAEREITIGDIVDIHEELEALEDSEDNIFNVLSGRAQRKEPLTEAGAEEESAEPEIDELKALEEEELRAMEAEEAELRALEEAEEAELQAMLEAEEAELKAKEAEEAELMAMIEAEEAELKAKEAKEAEVETGETQTAERNTPKETEAQPEPADEEEITEAESETELESEPEEGIELETETEPEEGMELEEELEEEALTEEVELSEAEAEPVSEDELEEEIAVEPEEAVEEPAAKEPIREESVREESVREESVRSEAGSGKPYEAVRGIHREAVQQTKETAEPVKNAPVINPYTGREYENNSVRMHPKRIGYVQVYDRNEHKWNDMTEWAFLGYQERLKVMLGKAYEPPVYLD